MTRKGKRKAPPGGAGLERDAALAGECLPLSRLTATAPLSGEPRARREARESGAKGLTGGESIYKVLMVRMMERKVKQVELARMLGIDRTSLWYKLHGKRTFTLPEAQKIAAFLGGTVDELFRTGG